jgi:hypothetical protein
MTTINYIPTVDTLYQQSFDHNKYWLPIPPWWLLSIQSQQSIPNIKKVSITTSIDCWYLHNYYQFYPSSWYLISTKSRSQLISTANTSITTINSIPIVDTLYQQSLDHNKYWLPIPPWWLLSIQSQQFIPNINKVLITISIDCWYLHNYYQFYPNSRYLISTKYRSQQVLISDTSITTINYIPTVDTLYQQSHNHNKYWLLIPLWLLSIISQQSIPNINKVSITISIYCWYTDDYYQFYPNSRYLISTKSQSQ